MTLPPPESNTLAEDYSTEKSELGTCLNCSHLRDVYLRFYCQKRLGWVDLHGSCSDWMPRLRDSLDTTPTDEELEQMESRIKPLQRLYL